MLLSCYAKRIERNQEEEAMPKGERGCINSRVPINKKRTKLIYEDK